MSEHFSKCPKGLSQNLTIGLNLKFPAKTLQEFPNMVDSYLSSTLLKA
jgi:hypothetical protein